MKYVERTYRQLHRQTDLVHFEVGIKETDLDIAVVRERFNPQLVAWIQELIAKLRSQLEEYMQRDSRFVKAMQPYPLLPNAPPMAVDMANAAKAAGVGPMAAVAGAFSQYVGKELSRRSKDIIIENGGDIYLRSTKKRLIGIFAADSPFSKRVALEIPPQQTPLGICTSSGTVGHSLSFGRADAVIVLSPSAILADAAATAAANTVQTAADLQKAVDFALGINGVIGAVAVCGDKMAVRGQIKLTPI